MARRTSSSWGAVTTPSSCGRWGSTCWRSSTPEVAEQEIAKQLEAEEEAAARATSFIMVDDGHGKARGRFTLPSLHGQMLLKLLQGFANPQIEDAIPRTEPSRPAAPPMARRAM